MSTLPDEVVNSPADAGSLKIEPLHPEKREADISFDQEFISQKGAINTVVGGNISYDNACSHMDNSADEATERQTHTHGQEQQQLDSDTVWWNSSDEHNCDNPTMWTNRKKWTNIMVLAICTLITPLASSMLAPGVPQVMVDFHNSDSQLATFVVSVYVLGFAFGPLFIAPASELYGRTICYNICNVLFVILSICCAISSNYGMLVTFRFLMGCAGSAPLTIGGGTIADMMPTEKRAGAMSIWIMGPLLGPVIGPVASGYLVEAKGWRWVFWLLAIVGCGSTILALLCLRETYAPVLLDRKVARLRKETGNMNLRSGLDSGFEYPELVKRSLIRPVKMLFCSPAVLLLSIYMAVAYGILYVLFTTFTFVFKQQYHFSPSNVGLAYIPIGIGMILSMSVLGIASDRIIKSALERKEILTPEHRLPYVLTIPCGLMLPIGLLVYGWTSQFHVHWAVPLFGTVLVGAGLNGCMMCCNFYMVDAFNVHAASALAASTVLRSMAGAFLPMGALQMYDRIGLGWGNSVLAIIALILVPIPVFFRNYGHFLRKKFAVRF